MKYSRICKTLEDTKQLAHDFANLVHDGCFVNLYGEIGAGKTAFVKLVADALGVQEKVTSPSFVILNEYHSAKLPIYHFDLYRLEHEGVRTIADELREYSEGRNITFVEWAEFSQDEIKILNLRDMSLEEHYKFYENEKLDKKEIIKKIAKDRNVNKNEIYQYFLNK